MYRTYREPTVEQLLQEALAYELAGARAYQLMVQQAPDAASEHRLAALRRDERRHHLSVVAVYDELTGIWDEGGEPSLSLPTAYPEMLKTAICDKLAGVSLYEQLIAHFSCPRQKLLLCQIMNEEKQHARLLAALYEEEQARYKKPAYQEPFMWHEGLWQRPYKY